MAQDKRDTEYVRIVVLEVFYRLKMDCHVGEAVATIVLGFCCIC